MLAGSTGLIGRQLLELLLTDSNFEKIIAISRKPLEVQDSKFINLVCELNHLKDHADELKADVIFCCLGTTIKKAKTQKEFRSVDYDAPLEIAELTKANGASQYLLISALGANKNSNIFYNRVKGEVEEAIRKVGFRSFHIFRPSLLLGDRNEHRSGEDAAKIFYRIFGWMIPLKYKGIESTKVAKAMITVANKNLTGDFIYQSDQIQKL